MGSKLQSNQNKQVALSVNAAIIVFYDCCYNAVQHFLRVAEYHLNTHCLQVGRWNLSKRHRTITIPAHVLEKHKDDADCEGQKLDSSETLIASAMED
jgi:hypothetical protein